MGIRGEQHELEGWTADVIVQLSTLTLELVRILWYTVVRPCYRIERMAFLD